MRTDYLDSLLFPHLHSIPSSSFHFLIFFPSSFFSLSPLSHFPFLPSLSFTSLIILPFPHRPSLPSSSFRPSPSFLYLPFIPSSSFLPSSSFPSLIFLSSSSFPFFHSLIFLSTIIFFTFPHLSLPPLTFIISLDSSCIVAWISGNFTNCCMYLITSVLFSNEPETRNVAS